ncbi:MAG TPA: N-acetyltransferase [Terriglobales bacterium]|nr:N-acetyltransferase [Terriglobales bacterium]
MDIRIRESRPEDFEALWRLDQECFVRGISYSKKELGWYMKMKGAFTLVAEPEIAKEKPSGEGQEGRRAAAEVAGFIVAQDLGKGMGHVVTIDVQPQLRRTGVGLKLMQAAEQRLQGEGCHTIYLETAVDNDNAIRFYKRLSYFVLKVIPRYYLNRIDALLLAKRLE